MALQAESMADLLTTTQKKLNRFKWVDASQRLNAYPTFEMLMSKQMVDFLDDGTAIQWNVKVVRGATARSTGYFATDVINQGDTQKVASLGFKHVTHNYAFDEKEPVMNSGESRIVEEMKVRRTDCWVEVAEKVETMAWAAAAATSGDDISSIPYHVVKAAAGTTPGFTGGNPVSSDWCGLNRSTYTGLKNYQGSYIGITKDDFVSKLSDALDRCYFRPPVDFPAYGQKPIFQYYTTLALRKGLKQLLEAQNDNLGEDVDAMNGRLRIRQTPVNWTPVLDADTDVPFYGLNTSPAGIRFKVLRPFYLREKGPKEVSLQHTTFVFFVDLTCNLTAFDPRTNFVLSKDNAGTAG